MRDPVQYFKDITGLVPTEDQSKFLYALVDPSIKNIIACAGRQVGKSICSAVAVLYWVFEYTEPVEVLLMSSMDSYVYDHIEKLFNRNKDLTEQVVVEGVSGLVPLRGFSITKGSRVHVRKGTQRQIRGLGIDIVIIDEAAELPNDMVTTALGNLRGSIAKFVMLSTPHKTGIFTEMVSNPKKYRCKVFNWSELNCSWHTKEELDLKRATMSNQVWKMEVEGKVLSSGERSYFASKHIDKCVHQNVTREASPGSYTEVGIDFGYDPCRTVIVVTEKIGSRRKVILVKWYCRKAIEEIAPDIGRIIDSYSPRIVKADSMPQEYKGKLEPYTKTRIIYIPAKYLKDSLLGQLKHKIQVHSLEIDEKEVDLIKELRAYRRNMHTGDDLVDALAISIYEPSIPYNVKPSGTVIFSNK